jgi:hypothetical protein
LIHGVVFSSAKPDVGRQGHGVKRKGYCPQTISTNTVY